MRCFFDQWASGAGASQLVFGKAEALGLTQQVHEDKHPRCTIPGGEQGFKTGERGLP